MGLFNKFGKGKNKVEKDAQDTHAEESSKKTKGKKAKKAKEKKSRFGGKRKEMTLIERMQLEESVAAASLDVVEMLAEEGNSAVREVDDGFLIVAITNEMLEEAGLDPSGEEFGSFAEGLRSETIESIALAEDLNDGVIGLIPSQETLIALDEFDFVHDLNFRWALVPFDLEDEDRLVMLENDVHITRLFDIANDSSIGLEIQNGEVVDSDGAGETEAYDEGVSDDTYDNDGLDDEQEDFGYDETMASDGLEDDAGYGEGLEDDGESFDEPEPLDLDDDLGFDNDDLDTFDTEDDLDFEDTGIDDELDTEPLDFDDDGQGMDDTDDVDDIDDSSFEDDVSAEESKEVINRVATHGFNNNELDLNIDMSIFDDYFDSVTIAQFDTTKQDDGELHNVISKLRQDANIELKRFHQENIQSLRNKFTTSMRDIHNELVDALDHKDRNSTYGSRYVEIENEYEDSMDDLDRHVAGEVDEIHREYNRNREEFAENARREALAVYDSRYKESRDRKIASVRDNVQTDLKTKRDTQIGELYADRRIVAQRLFDKATTSLLQRLQEEYQEISRRELQMYDAFRKDMDVYLRKHFADEVLRSKAEAEKLRQSHEAERVRQEYEQMLLAKTSQLEEREEREREKIRQLEEAHKEQLAHAKKDYEDRLAREQRENQNLRELLQESNQSNSRIGEQKEKEIEHRMNMYKDALEAKEKELEYANDRASKAQKPMWVMVGAVAAIGIALGIIFGFMFGANSTQHYAPPAPDVEQNPPAVSYESTDSQVEDVVFEHAGVATVIDFGEHKAILPLDMHQTTNHVA